MTLSIDEEHIITINRKVQRETDNIQEGIKGVETSVKELAKHLEQLASSIFCM